MLLITNQMKVIHLNRFIFPPTFHVVDSVHGILTAFNGEVNQELESLHAIGRQSSSASFEFAGCCDCGSSPFH